MIHSSLDDIEEFKKRRLEFEPGAETESAADTSAVPEPDANAICRKEKSLKRIRR